VPATNSLSADALTQGQIDCLLLVGRHFTSKEIASNLGISRHTVDQRIGAAMRTLRVKRRGDAARMVIEQYGPVFQWGSGSLEPFVVSADEGRAMPSPNSLWLPFATRVRPRNEMSIARRLVWIVAIGFGAAASAGVYLTALESWSRLLAHQ